MSYFEPYLDGTGLHMPTYTDIRDWLLTGYRQIFGSDIYLGEDSQDYQFLSLLAKALDDFAALAVDDYNARNPDWATGAALDLLLPLAGIKRRAATFSTAALSMTGTAGASVAAGALVRDQAGYSWRITAAFTFDENGAASGSAICTQAGAIAAPAGTITVIETPTSAWLTVTNPADAVMGQDVESDADVRARRSASIALSAASTLDGIQSALVNLSGVTHVALLENSTAETDANGLPAHSICALVQGGSDSAIGELIFRKKAPGIGTWGNTSVSYTDIYGHSNTVRFSRPTAATVTIRITLRALSGWDSSTMPDAIRACVAAALDSVGIGEDLIVSALWGEIFKANEGSSPAFSVTSVTAETEGGTASADSLTASYDTRFCTDAEHVLLTVSNA